MKSILKTFNSAYIRLIHMFLITVIGLFVKIPKTLKQTLNPNKLIPINSFYISVTKKEKRQTIVTL